MISDTSHFSSQIHFTLHSLRTDSKGLTPTTLEQNVLSLLLPRSNALNSIQSWWSKYRKQVLTRANQYLNCCERTTSKELTSTEKHLVATDVEEKVLSRHFSEWEECCINFLLHIIGLRRLSIWECRCFCFSIDDTILSQDSPKPGAAQVKYFASESQRMSQCRDLDNHNFFSVAYQLSLTFFFPFPNLALISSQMAQLVFIFSTITSYSSNAATGNRTHVRVAPPRGTF